MQFRTQVSQAPKYVWITRCFLPFLSACLFSTTYPISQVVRTSIFTTSRSVDCDQELLCPARPCLAPTTQIVWLATMCGDTNKGPALSSGDLIAITHPVPMASTPFPLSVQRPPKSKREPSFSCKMHLSNRNSSSTVSTFLFQPTIATTVKSNAKLEVRIQ